MQQKRDAAKWGKRLPHSYSDKKTLKALKHPKQRHPKQGSKTQAPCEWLLGSIKNKNHRACKDDRTKADCTSVHSNRVICKMQILKNKVQKVGRVSAYSWDREGYAYVWRLVAAQKCIEGTRVKL